MQAFENLIGWYPIHAGYEFSFQSLTENAREKNDRGMHRVGDQRPIHLSLNVLQLRNGTSHRNCRNRISTREVKR